MLIPVVQSAIPIFWENIDQSQSISIMTRNRERAYSIPATSTIKETAFYLCGRTFEVRRSIRLSPESQEWLLYFKYNFGI